MQILCATDFSEPAARAVDVAAAFAQALNMPLRVVHCMPDWPYMSEPTMVGDDVVLNSWRRLLDAEVERQRAKGVEVTGDLRRGDASHEILAAVEQHPVKFVFLGSTGSGLAGRWLLGRVAERVAESAPVVVMVIRQADSILSWLKSGKSLRVLCGVDFNQSSDAALTAVKELGSLGKVEVEAAHIREEKQAGFAVAGRKPAEAEEDERTAEEVRVGRDVWDRVNDILNEPPVTVHVPRTARHADREMVNLADEREVDLIVVGSHQWHGWERLRHHSFSRGVLAHAATNVLCVPAAAIPPAFKIPHFHRVVAAVDLDTNSQDALRYALGLLGDGGEIRVLHVLPAPEPGGNPLRRSVIYLGNSMEAGKAQAAAQAELERLISNLPTTRRVKLTAEAILHDDTAAGICEASEKFGADVICMGTHNRSLPAAAVRGSVVQKVMSHGHRPVFVIPPPIP